MQLDYSARRDYGDHEEEFDHSQHTLQVQMWETIAIRRVGCYALEREVFEQHEDMRNISTPGDVLVDTASSEDHKTGLMCNLPRVFLATEPRTEPSTTTSNVLAKRELEL